MAKVAKEKIELPKSLNSDLLKVGHYYFSNLNELHLIKSIDRSKNRIHMVNMSDVAGTQQAAGCNIFTDLDRHNLVKKVR